MEHALETANELGSNPLAKGQGLRWTALDFDRQDQRLAAHMAAELCCWDLGGLCGLRPASKRLERTLCYKLAGGIDSDRATDGAFSAIGLNLSPGLAEGNDRPVTTPCSVELAGSGLRRVGRRKNCSGHQ